MTVIERQKKATVFLDTSVLLAYLGREGAAARLFDPEVTSRARYAINPVVLQELLLTADSKQRPEIAQLVEDRVRVLPTDPDKTDEILRRLRDVRNKLAHSNDALVVASASDCDYLVTEDPMLVRLQEGSRPEVITTKEFLARVLR